MAAIRQFTTAEATGDELSEIRRLLGHAFADDDGHFSDEDWGHTFGGHHVVVDDDGRIVADAAVVGRVFHVARRRFCAGYVDGVATAAARQGQGSRLRAVVEAAEVIRDRFDLGALSTGRHRFYERLGRERWQGPTYASTRAGPPTRTVDDDGGVMVLRFGPSAGVDLTAAITCQTRPGDDW